VHIARFWNKLYRVL